MIWVILCFALSQLALAIAIGKILTRVIRIDRRLATSNHLLSEVGMHRLEEARHAGN